jgi:sugar/nucleoside kinase (ribokinase family)
MALYDVLTVGDATSDVFIRLSDSHIRTWDDEKGHWMDLPFGGKVPFDYARTVDAGGNASNASVGLARLGVSTAIAAHVGSDQIGRDMLAALHREGVDTHLVRLDPAHPSNRNFVLWYGQDRTILVHHELYDYHWPDLSPREIPRWIYLSSVGSDGAAYYRQILGWLESEPTVRLVFQPGTFQIAQGPSALRGLYERADVLVCNREEACAIGGAAHCDLAAILESMHALGPRIAVVTDGPDGAYASDGSQRYRVPSYLDPAPPLERTGAGDAFTSALVAALVKGHPLETALAWGPINAMRVVQEVGSQTGLLAEDALLRYLADAPDGYVVTTW